MIDFSIEAWQGSSTYISNLQREYDIKAHTLNCGQYTTLLDRISIIPTCLPENVWHDIGWKERTYISWKKRYADIRLRISYEAFCEANHDGRKQLVIDNIVASARVIERKTKGEFKTDAFLCDILGEDYVYIQESCD